MNGTLAKSFALSVAALVAAGCTKQGSSSDAESASGNEAKVKCMGVNQCKAQGACDTATHSCAGQNECRGKGWMLVPKTECERKGGQLI